MIPTPSSVTGADAESIDFNQTSETEEIKETGPAKKKIKTIPKSGKSKGKSLPGKLIW
jgi:hypothetical protein